MKALAFLGIGDYQQVTYVWRDAQGERSFQTHLFPEAVARIFQPEKLLVFVTAQARAHAHFQTLAQRLEDLLEPVDIPEGRLEGELWQIFDRVASSVEESDTVLLDITHAFRSIPMIVFAVAAYLRRTKNVKVERIVYGAYEARDENNRASIFDLTPLLDLLDWLSGVEFFLQRSDGSILAERLIRIQDAIRRQHPQPQAGTDLPTKLKTVGDKLELLSQALHLARPRDVMHYAYELLPRLEAAASEAGRWAKPFAVILEQIRSEAKTFAHDAPDRLDKDNLRKQLHLVEHFVAKGLLMQAVTLAREWVVSWVALQKGDGDWLDLRYREKLEKALGAADQRLQGKQAEVPEWIDHLPKSQEVASLWSRLTQLRNDLAHCGMREDVRDISSIERGAKEIPRHLTVLMNDAPEHVLYGGRVRRGR